MGETPREPLPKAKLNFIHANKKSSLDELNLLPLHPWKKKIESKWDMGEESAMKRLDDFLERNSKLQRGKIIQRNVLFPGFLLIFT